MLRELRATGLAPVTEDADGHRGPQAPGRQAAQLAAHGRPLGRRDRRHEPCGGGHAQGRARRHDDEHPAPARALAQGGGGRDAEHVGQGEPSDDGRECPGRLARPGEAYRDDRAHEHRERRPLPRDGERAEREGRNPATGATIKIAASKAVRFRVSKPLKDAVNG